MKKIYSFGIALFTLIIFPHTAFAIPCEKIYGGGSVPSCTPAKASNDSLKVLKNVQMPGKGGEFVKNLGLNDARYAAGQTIPFQIIITNTGNSSLSNIEVTDTLPQYIKFDSGNGKYDSGKNTVTNTISKLDAGKSQTFLIVGKTVSSTAFPSGQTVICLTNMAKAQAGNISGQDSSQFCIDKTVATVNTSQTKGGVLPTPQVFQNQNPYQTPATGPETLAIPLLAATGLLGGFLKHKIG